MSSIGIRNGLSTSRCGSGMYLSTASINARIDFAESSLPEPFGAMKSARQRFGDLTPSTTGRTLCTRRPRQVNSTSLLDSSR